MAGKQAGGKLGQRGEFVVTMNKAGQPQVAPPQTSKLAVIVVAVVFGSVFFVSLGGFTYFMLQDPMS